MTLLTSRLVLITLLASWLAGCSSSEPVVEAPAEPVEMMPARTYDAILRVDGKLAFSDAATGGESMFGPAGRATFASVSPVGRTSVLGVSGPDSSALYLIDFSNGLVEPLHRGGGNLAYSGDWKRDGSEFAFGFYSGDADAMGRGGIRRVNAESATVSDVGCVAAKAVLSWRSNGNLIVRDADNLYEVSADDCATVSTVDARKMYYVTPSPDGDRLAYVLRDLVYNREARSYDPDSTLYIQPWGGESEKIIGDRYSPRFPAWSPDGTELAYDVRLPDAPGTRAVSIYTATTGQSSYLVPPTEGAASRYAPAWSPGGDYMMYRQGAGGELQYRSFAESFARAIPLETVGGTAERILWAGPDHVLVRGAGRESMLFSLASGEVVDSGEHLVFASRVP